MKRITFILLLISLTITPLLFSSPVSAADCTSWTYSDWGTCTANTQTRTILTSLPAGCTGGTPADLSQACTPTEEPMGPPAPAGTTPAADATPAPAESYDLPNFLGPEAVDPNVVIGRVVKYIMGFVGTIALVTFMYGGILWLISGGREAYVDKGRDTMVWSAVGMVVVFASYILVDFIFKLLGQ